MTNQLDKKEIFIFLSVEGIKNLLDRYNTKEIVIELTYFKNKQRTEVFLAETNGHGNWIKWNNYSTIPCFAYSVKRSRKRKPPDPGGYQ